MNESEFAELVKHNKKCEHERCPYFQKEKRLTNENNHYKALVPVLEDNAEQLRNDLKQAKEIIRKLARIVQEATAFDLITDTAEILHQATLFMEEVK